jgi:hypothetical protein
VRGVYGTGAAYALADYASYFAFDLGARSRRQRFRLTRPFDLHRNVGWVAVWFGGSRHGRGLRRYFFELRTMDYLAFAFDDAFPLADLDGSRFLWRCGWLATRGGR